MDKYEMNSLIALEQAKLAIFVALDEEGVDHLSISHPHRLPKWEEITKARELYLDSNKVYVQMLPKKEDYVNVHINCLHLWELNETLLKRY